MSPKDSLRKTRCVETQRIMNLNVKKMNHKMRREKTKGKIYARDPFSSPRRTRERKMKRGMMEKIPGTLIILAPLIILMVPCKKTK